MPNRHWPRRHPFLLVALLSWVALAVPVAEAQRPVAPRVVLRDDAAGDPDFAAFKAQLLAAAEAGDTAALLVSMTPDVDFMYEPSTPASVLRVYQVTPGRPWLALRDALRLGTARVNNEFVAPSTSMSDLGDDDAIIIARGVRLRAAPSDRAPVLQVLSWLQVVTLDRALLYDAGLTERCGGQ